MQSSLPGLTHGTQFIDKTALRGYTLITTIQTLKLNSLYKEVVFMTTK